MKILEGIEGAHDNKVCKLLKFLHGLKQASKKWYQKLANLLIMLRYKKAHSDLTLFTKQTTHNFTALLIYVDDIVLTGDSI